jgi:hypothetical protein
MSRFGKTLFGGGRFIFWSLAPVLAFCAVVVPFLVASWTVVTFLVISLIEALLLTLILGLFDPRRFKWATRCVTGIVFCLFLVYAVDEIFADFKGSGGSGSSALKAVTGLIAVGLPCLWYTLLGRFSRKAEDKTGDGGPGPSDKLDAIDLDL